MRSEKRCASFSVGVRLGCAYQVTSGMRCARSTGPPSTEKTGIMCEKQASMRDSRSVRKSRR